MKSNTAIEKVCTELKQRREHATFLRSKGLEKNYEHVMAAVGACEDILRTAGFTVKRDDAGNYTIRCKWSDAPEALKNG